MLRVRTSAAPFAKVLRFNVLLVSDGVSVSGPGGGAASFDVQAFKDGVEQLRMWNQVCEGRVCDRRMFRCVHVYTSAVCSCQTTDKYEK